MSDDVVISAGENSLPVGTGTTSVPTTTPDVTSAVSGLLTDFMSQMSVKMESW